MIKTHQSHQRARWGAFMPSAGPRRQSLGPCAVVLAVMCCLGHWGPTAFGQAGFDGFESGNFNTLPWQFAGQNWVIDETSAAEGTNSARSGATTESIQSAIGLDVMSAGVAFQIRNESDPGSTYQFSMNEQVWFMPAFEESRDGEFRETIYSVSTPPQNNRYWWEHLLRGENPSQAGFLDEVYCNLAGNPQSVNARIPWFLRSYGRPYLVEYTFMLQDKEGAAISPANINDVLLTAFEDQTAIIPGLETNQALDYLAVRPVRSFLVLDYTQSMFVLQDAIPAMEQGAKYYINNHRSDAQIGIIEFHREDQDPQMVTNLTANKEFLAGQVDRIWTDYVQNFPASSRCWDAVYMAVDEFDVVSTGTLMDELRIVVFISDGMDESSLATPQEIIDAANARNVMVYTIGYGNFVVPADLQNIALSTGGRYFEALNAEAIEQSFSQIIEVIGGHMTVRWATLRRHAAGAFTPAFKLEYTDSRDIPRYDVFIDNEQYNPEAYAGDVLAGELRFTGSPLLNNMTETEVYLRTTYMPRHVTQMLIYVRVDTPGAEYAVSLVPQDEGGIPDILGWELDIWDEDAEGGIWYLLSSPNMNDIRTAIPFAWMGNLLKFEFTNLRSLADLFVHGGLTAEVDNSIYPAGQYFTLAPFPEVADMRVTPQIDLVASGPVGGPFTFNAPPQFVIENTGTLDYIWTALVVPGTQPTATNWLRVVGPGRGALAPGASAQVTLQINNTVADRLGGGIYYANVDVANDDGVVPVSIRVALRINVDAAAPVINSPTHPDENQTYTSNTVAFTWTPGGAIAPELVAGYYVRFDQDPLTVPTISDTFLTAAETTYTEVPDGTHYFHARTLYTFGELSPAGHRRVNVGDTEVDVDWVNPRTDMSPSGVTGGPFAPNRWTYTLSNPLDSDIQWRVRNSAGAPWVSVTTATATLAPGATQTTQIFLTESANHLNPGFYSAPMVFEDESGLVQPETRIVRLVVEPLPTYPFPNIDQFYQIDYMPSDNGRRERLTTAVVIVNGGLRDQLRIRRRPGIADELYPEIPVIRSDTGSFFRIYTEAPVTRVVVGGQLRNLVARRAHVETIVAGEVGTIRMAGVARSFTLPGLAPESVAFTSILATSSQPFNPNGRFLQPTLQATGVVLEGFSTVLQQGRASILVASKLNRARDQSIYLSLGAVTREYSHLPHMIEPYSGSLPGLPEIPDAVEAHEIARLVTRGGQISPQTIEAQRIGQISAAGQSFSIRPPVSRRLFVTRHGDIQPFDIRTSGLAPSMAIVARGGNIQVGTQTGAAGELARGGIFTGGSLRLEARLRRVRQVLAETVHGGVIGFPPSQFIPGGATDFTPLMRVEAGVPELRMAGSAAGNIDNIRADLAVFGHFVASDAGDGETITPTGAIGPIVTQLNVPLWAAPREDWWFHVAGKAYSTQPIRVRTRANLLEDVMRDN